MPPKSLDAQPPEDHSLSSENIPAAREVPDPVEAPVDDPPMSPQTPLVQTPASPENSFPEDTPPIPPSPSTFQRIGKTVLWGSLFGGTAVASACLGAVLALSVPLPRQLAPHQAEALGLGELWQSGFRYRVTRPVNLLLMGIDEVPDVPKDSEEIFSGRTDSLLLARIDPDSNATSLLSIPRDTRVRIPGYGTAKINHANVEGGPELVAQTLSSNLGSIAVDRYIRVSTGAFREIVDLVGGVEVYVPKRMEYEDRTQDLYIDLYPGWQTLDGSQAEQFARFRQDQTGDIGRVQRQQILLKALRERLTSPAVIPKLPQIVRVLQRYIDTNLSVEEMLALANFALSMQADDLHMVMLPGRFSEVSEYNASYWLADSDATAQIMQNFFQVETVATLAGHGSLVPAELSIAVQNASDSPDMATKVARYLRKQGFYNVYVVSNWPNNESRTQVIAQRGDLAGARTLAAVLGNGRVVSDSTGDLQSDITIRIGEDWREPSTRETGTEEDTTVEEVDDTP
ncbi:MAG: LCP family protein [Cyanobacteria bacterium Co-bin8]|nr:LCP family protein [Cyanobacteria bacterium Co-bin8]